MIIEYFCKNCDKIFEIIDLKNKKNSRKKCPTCGKLSAKVEFSKSSVAFKGGGWFNSGGY